MAKHPVVLSLAPEAVIGPVHERLAAGMAAHTLIYLNDVEGDMRAALGTADYIIGDWTHQHQLDTAGLDAAIRCRAIFQPTVGVQAIDTQHAATIGIPVTNAPATNDAAVAEWTVMAILALLKDVWRHHLSVQAGRWDMVDAGRTGVHELGGRTVGIVGLGRIGQAVARRLVGFELGRLVYADIEQVEAGVERRLGVERLPLDELCRVSDAVTLHVPLVPSTRGLLDARRIGLLPQGAVLVNVARGAVVDQAALFRALHSGRLKAAALDVFEHEPLPAADPLRSLDNVLFSPHLAGSTNEARERMASSALHNLDGVLRGKAPQHVINGLAGLPRDPVYTT